MGYSLHIVSIMVFVLYGLSQDLVLNPKFESGAIPTGVDQVSLATGWSKLCGRTLNSYPPGVTNSGPRFWLISDLPTVLTEYHSTNGVVQLATFHRVIATLRCMEVT